MCLTMNMGPITGKSMTRTSTNPSGAHDANDANEPTTEARDNVASAQPH